MNSDTPETNAYIGQDNDDFMTEGEIAMCDFARRMERERNEARKEAHKLRSLFYGYKWPKHMFSWEVGVK